MTCSPENFIHIKSVSFVYLQEQDPSWTCEEYITYSTLGICRRDAKDENNAYYQRLMDDCEQKHECQSNPPDTVQANVSLSVNNCNGRQLKYIEISYSCGPQILPGEKTNKINKILYCYTKNPNPDRSNTKNANMSKKYFIIPLPEVKL